MITHPFLLNLFKPPGKKKETPTVLKRWRHRKSLWSRATFVRKLICLQALSCDLGTSPWQFLFAQQTADQNENNNKVYTQKRRCHYWYEINMMVTPNRYISYIHIYFTHLYTYQYEYIYIYQNQKIWYYMIMISPCIRGFYMQPTLTYTCSTCSGMVT